MQANTHVSFYVITWQLTLHLLHETHAIIINQRRSSSTHGVQLPHIVEERAPLPAVLSIKRQDVPAKQQQLLPQRNCAVEGTGSWAWPWQQVWH
jgi:hypothetical protein